MLFLDPDSREVFLEGKELKLSRIEFELLRHLTGTPGKAFTRAELLKLVWGPNHFDIRRVDLHISRIRAKLKRPGRASLIQSVWGVGYRFQSLVHDKEPRHSLGSV